jgi:hypothetical protein
MAAEASLSPVSSSLRNTRQPTVSGLAQGMQSKEENRMWGGRRLWFGAGSYGAAPLPHLAITAINDLAKNGNALNTASPTEFGADGGFEGEGGKNSCAHSNPPLAPNSIGLAAIKALPAIRVMQDFGWAMEGGVEGSGGTSRTSEVDCVIVSDCSVASVQ